MSKLIGLFGKKQTGKDTAARLIQEIIIESKGNTDMDYYFTYPHRAAVSSGYEVKRFARPLKEILSILTGIPVDDMEKEEVKSALLGEEWRYYFYAGKCYDCFNQEHYTRPLLGRIFSSEDECAKGFVIERVPLDARIKSKIPTLREALELIGTGLLRNQFHPECHINATFSKWSGQDWILADGRFVNEASKVKTLGGFTIKLLGETDLETSIAEKELGDLVTDYYVTNERGLAELKQALKSILLNEGIIK